MAYRANYMVYFLENSCMVTMCQLKVASYPKMSKQLSYISKDGLPF